MNAKAKSEGFRRVRAAKVEGFGFRKDRGVATRGGQPEEQLGAFRQVHTSKGHRTPVTRRHAGTGVS